MLIVEDEISDSLPLPRNIRARRHPASFFRIDSFHRRRVAPAPSRRLRSGPPIPRYARAVTSSSTGSKERSWRSAPRSCGIRVLNASNARVYNLGFSNDRTFHQIASDGGFLSSPAPMSRLILAPAERAELLDRPKCRRGPAHHAEFVQRVGTGPPSCRPRLQDEWDTARTSNMLDDRKWGRPPLTP